MVVFAGQSARWATLEEVEAAGYVTKYVESERLLLGPLGEGVIRVPPEETEAHALVCGPTGCGKTSSIFIPNLLERLDTSAIVTEATAGSQHTGSFTIACA